MSFINITQVRPNLKELADRVCFYGKQICVERNGKPAFALISIEDLHLLEALEDKIDLDEAREILAKESGSVSLDQVRTRLGI